MPPSGPTRSYLVAYNGVSFALWASCTLRAAWLALTSTAGATIFHEIYYPLLTATQTLAVLEILHSLLGVVRAPVTTTAMQVASRLLLVWGVMGPFQDHGDGSGIVGAHGESARIGNVAFLGCLSAWGVTECIRYGFFALQVLGVAVPAWWMWLRSFFLSFFSRYGKLRSQQVQYFLRALSCRYLKRVYPCRVGARAGGSAASALPVVSGGCSFDICAWYVCLWVMRVPANWRRVLYPVHAYDLAEAEGAQREKELIDRNYPLSMSMSIERLRTAESSTMESFRCYHSGVLVCLKSNN